MFWEKNEGLLLSSRAPESEFCPIPKRIDFEDEDTNYIVMVYHRDWSQTTASGAVRSCSQAWKPENGRVDSGNFTNYCVKTWPGRIFFTWWQSTQARRLRKEWLSCSVLEILKNGRFCKYLGRCAGDTVGVQWPTSMAFTWLPRALHTDKTTTTTAIHSNE